MLAAMSRNIVLHGRIRTTVGKAKHAQPQVDRLITLGKDGSVHARRQAFRILQDRDLVKQLFAEIAPRFLDVRGGYTRVLRLGPRAGDGAPTALLELTRLPAEETFKASEKKAQAKKAAASAAAQASPEKKEEAAQKPKPFFEGLRKFFRPKKGGAES